MLFYFKYLFIFICSILYTNLANAQIEDSIVVFFENNKSSLSGEQLQKLQQNIRVKELNNQKVLIYAYTDKIGETDKNLNLSLQRAQYLADKSQEILPNLQIRVVKGRGEDIAAHNSAAMPKARRAVMYILANNANEVVINPTKPNENVLTELPVVNKYGAIDIADINFYGNLDLILPTSQAALNQLILTMQKNPNIKFEIQGHICCDTILGVDPTSYAFMLSVKRAKVIYQKLVEAGIAKSRMRYRGYGATQPLYTDYTKEDEIYKNRRVSIRILSK